jgi:hypothetical protein
VVQKAFLLCCNVYCATLDTTVDASSSTMVKSLCPRNLDLLGYAPGALRNQSIDGMTPSMHIKTTGMVIILTFSFSLGNFVFLEDFAGGNKLYPAEIISRSSDGPVVNLRWYSGNLSPGQGRRANFQLPLSVCMGALFSDSRSPSQPVRNLLPKISQNLIDVDGKIQSTCPGAGGTGQRNHVFQPGSSGSNG